MTCHACGLLQLAVRGAGVTGTMAGGDACAWRARRAGTKPSTQAHTLRCILMRASLQWPAADGAPQRLRGHADRASRRQQRARHPHRRDGRATEVSRARCMRAMDGCALMKNAVLKCLRHLVMHHFAAVCRHRPVQMQLHAGTHAAGQHAPETWPPLVAPACRRVACTTPPMQVYRAHH